MSNCKEFILDDLMAITAIPVSDISMSAVGSPTNRLTPTIPDDEFNPSLENAIVIGKEPATTGGVLVPIRRSTGRAKDDTSDSVTGRLHTVSVNCEIDERGGEIWAPISSMGNTPCNFRLERVAHHLLLTFNDGTKEGSQGFVAATPDAYQCMIERDGAKMTVSFKINNMMGIQMIV